MKSYEERARHKFEDLKSKSHEITPEIVRTAQRKSNKVFRWFPVAVEMLIAILAGKFTPSTKTIIASIAAAVMYVALTLDAIPDFLPGVGFLDDLFILSLIAAPVKSEIKRFLAWKRARR